MSKIRGSTNKRSRPKARQVRSADVADKPLLPEVAKMEQECAAQFARERQKRPQWHWLSFANNAGFLGGAIVWAHGVETAVLRARNLSISRGFSNTVDVFCEQIPRRVMKEHVPPDLRNRLLSGEEVRRRLNGRSIV
jgi:hypothetical protein